MNIKEESPPNIICASDRVTLMFDRFESIRNNYAGMLYFCQRIVGHDNISMADLRDFEIVRFHTNEAFKKNMSFPVSSYLQRIAELEKEIAQLKRAPDDSNN